jgi:hypothetical protein
MKPGSLRYQNNYKRIPQPLIGIIIEEKLGISIDQQFYNVLLENGIVKLISTHYLDFLQ